jgi:hypothetical protein
VATGSAVEAKGEEESRKRKFGPIWMIPHLVKGLRFLQTKILQVRDIEDRQKLVLMRIRFQHFRSLQCGSGSGSLRRRIRIQKYQNFTAEKNIIKIYIKLQFCCPEASTVHNAALKRTSSTEISSLFCYFCG